MSIEDRIHVYTMYSYSVMTLSCVSKSLRHILVQKQDVSVPTSLSPAPPADKKPKIEKVRIGMWQNFITRSHVLLLVSCMRTFYST